MNKYITPPDPETLEGDVLTILNPHLAGRNEIENLSEVESILDKAYEYYCQEFTRLVQAENTFQFYEWCYGVLDVLIVNKATKPRSTTIKHNFATIKSTLRLLLEEATGLSLIDKPEESNSVRFIATFDKMLQLIAKAHYAAGVIKICKLTGDRLCLKRHPSGYFTINRDPLECSFYETVFEELQRNLNHRIPDKNWHLKFNQFMSAEMNCTFNELDDELILALRNLKRTDLPLKEWHSLGDPLSRRFKMSKEKIFQFLKGVTLTSKHVQPLRERLKTNSDTRHMFRPLCVWRVNGKYRVIFKSETFRESISYLLIDILPWRGDLIPPEWKKNFNAKSYLSIGTKKDQVGNILEEHVLASLECHGFKVIKIPQVKDSNDKIPKIEYDIIFLNPENDTLYLCECKNLSKRFNVKGWSIDWNNFTKSKGYLEQIKRQETKLSDPDTFNKISQAFSAKYQDSHISKPLSHYRIEKFFVVNSATLYMFYATVPILFFYQFDDMLKKQNLDIRHNLKLREAVFQNQQSLQIHLVQFIQQLLFKTV